MSDRMSDEMGAPGYPVGDRATEEQQGGEPAVSDAGSSSAAGMDVEQGAGEGDLDPQNEEMIRRRAYEISQGKDAGSPEENWARAEREISSEQAGP